MEEDQYNDDELDGSRGEEDEHDLISLDQNEELLINSQGDSEADFNDNDENSSLDGINPDDLEEEGISEEEESFGEDIRSRSYGEDEDPYGDSQGFGEDWANSSQFRDNFTEDEFSSSMNSLYAQEREKHGHVHHHNHRNHPEFNLPGLPSLPREAIEGFQNLNSAEF